MTGRFASLTAGFRALVAQDPIDVPRAALAIAKLEFPHLDPEPSLKRLAELGDRAVAAAGPLGSDAPARSVLATISRELYDKAGFAGNRTFYSDFRNSLLNVVLERRLGIPITLALVFMEVAKRTNVDVRGVGFPGHFLMRGPDEREGRPLILDPFNGGRELGELDCRALLAETAGEDQPYSPDLLRPCTPRQMLARILNNLKRTYVEFRSFPQAYAATDMILAVDPSLLFELRDRGLLAYHLDDFPSALRDLEEYIRLHAWSDETKEERDEIWNHIKNLRRRVAGRN